jgi:SAM-dependent methyltransferase
MGSKYMKQQNGNQPDPSELSLPPWALTVLICPCCRGAFSFVESSLRCKQCGTTGKWQSGILRFPVTTADPSVIWYKAVDGTRFHERMRIPFTLSSLDTPVYWEYMRNLKPDSPEGLVLDVGAGDGRNTEPWLAWGHERVIGTDAVFSSLARFQSRVRAEHPEWLERLLLVECDVRQLPVASGKADLVLAVEVLYYLNEAYELGLSECKRLLTQNGRIMISERSWEGALLTRLLYGGVGEMLDISDTQDVLDGDPDNLVRSRTFTEEELVGIVEKVGLSLLELKGLSVMPLVFGYLRQQGRFSSKDEQHLQRLLSLLKKLGNTGKMRRTHVVVAGNTL